MKNFCKGVKTIAHKPRSAARRHSSDVCTNYNCSIYPVMKSLDVFGPCCIHISVKPENVGLGPLVWCVPEFG